MPNIDTEVVDAFRDAMAREAERSGGDGWELFGGPYDGSRFPRSACRVDEVLSISVSRDSSLWAVYQVVTAERARFVRIASQAELSAIATAQNQQPTAAHSSAFGPFDCRTLRSVVSVSVQAGLDAAVISLRAAGSWLARKGR